ncbi:MAG: hypothetical protein QN183_14090 [Armatimonadota bacterium]|nr:hypothetical protein [Armatimonadota bacterium]MDR7534055.1 hypothetical protein [Armatimonadota bacterium]MDR7537481.1 hypothetical protein [Armatimonadota bacterium]
MKKLAQPHLDTILRLLELADSPQNLEAMQYVVFQFDFKDYEQFIIECPPGSIRFNNLLRVAVFCDNLGFLVEHDAVDRETVYELFPIPWAKIEPVIQGMRRELDWPDAFDYFERLGRDYIKWWEAKRKRLKPLPPLEESKAAPRALTVARTRPPAPVRPSAPPRPATAVPGARPGVPQRPQPGAGPAMRVVPKPETKPAGKQAGEQRKPAEAARGKSAPRPKPQAKARR